MADPNTEQPVSNLIPEDGTKATAKPATSDIKEAIENPVTTHPPTTKLYGEYGVGGDIQRMPDGSLYRRRISSDEVFQPRQKPDIISPGKKELINPDPNTEQPTQAPEAVNPDPKPVALSASGIPVGETTAPEAAPVEPVLTHEPIPTSAPDPVSVTENLPPVESVETKVGTVPSALSHDWGNQFPAAIVDANRETATPTTETPGPSAEPTVVNPNQAAIDEANAQKNAILTGSLNDLTPADRSAMSQIDSKLNSLGAKKEPQPPYLGTPPGWDAEKPSVITSQIPPTPVVAPPRSTNERPIAASAAPRSEGILDKLRGLFGGRKPQTA